MNRIKESRIRAGLKQSELANLLHVAPPSVAQWENGRTAPSIDNIVNLAKILNVSTDFLLSVDSKTSSEGTTVRIGDQSVSVPDGIDQIEIDCNGKSFFVNIGGMK